MRIIANVLLFYQWDMEDIFKDLLVHVLYYYYLYQIVRTVVNYVLELHSAEYTKLLWN